MNILVINYIGRSYYSTFGEASQIYQSGVTYMRNESHQDYFSNCGKKSSSDGSDGSDYNHPAAGISIRTPSSPQPPQQQHKGKSRYKPSKRL
jgi:hypothetical protein